MKPVKRSPQAEQQREQSRQAARDQIKAIARRQMIEQGTAGTSLRSIAREMDMTAPAIYRYFSSVDDLITALIVDAFSALADTLEGTQSAQAHQPYAARLEAVLLAYRAWAVENPMDFQLIYGNPIPGYQAPREVTIPAVIRGFSVIVGLIEALFQSGQAAPRPPYDQVPPEQRAHIRAMIEQDGYPVSELALYLGVVGWTRLHGIIMLELFNHLQPVVGEIEPFYRHQVERTMQDFGLRM